MWENSPAEGYSFFNTLSNNCKIEEKNFANSEIIKKVSANWKFFSKQKNVQEIAGSCSVSVEYYERISKNYTGMTPIEYRKCI